MAMNKKEQQEMADLRFALAKANALHFTGPVSHDIGPPSWSEGIKNGYSFNSYNRSVQKACTAAHGHGYGQWDKVDSQRSIALFSTRLLALKALRHEMENQYAENLVAIDAQIAMEQPSRESVGS